MQTGIDETRIELACLEVRGQVYGVDVQQVREIVRAQALTPLPRAPELVEGVIDLRGVIVPVVDLGRALGGAPIADSAASRIAIVEVDGMAFGLRADAEVEHAFHVEHRHEAIALRCERDDGSGVATGRGAQFLVAQPHHFAHAVDEQPRHLSVLAVQHHDAASRVFGRRSRQPGKLARRAERLGEGRD